MGDPEELFAFRVALAFGRFDVDELRREVPAGLWLRWKAYFAVEPFGFPSEERRFAWLASILAKAEDGPKAFAYRPPWKRPQRAMTHEEFMASQTGKA